MNRFLTHLITLCLLIVSPTLMANKHQTVTFGLYDFPPDIIINAKGQCDGPAVKQLKKLFMFTSLSLNINCVDPARLYKLFAKGEVDMLLNIASTKALIGQSTVIQPQFHYINLAIASNKNLPDSRTISAIRSYDYEGHRILLSDQGFKFVDLKNGPDALELFALGRVAHHIGYIKEREMLDFHDEKHLKPADIEFKSLEKLPTYIHVSNQSVHKELIIEQLNKLISSRACSNLYDC
ncbi:hypothetical protein [Pseudoalteromonas tunicata]|uniref:hypothetical protein n=1 Tax=Pseudoalteromonas tunicata TaxID=314281 RepID=UPI00273D1B80|nr:hypothetical protein [Pseudoalteromonas tunicata]MDP4985081.1 hypothetical protein [Pseudoalteromonas tunicata]